MLQFHIILSYLIYTILIYQLKIKANLILKLKNVKKHEESYSFFKYKFININFSNFMIII